MKMIFSNPKPIRILIVSLYGIFILTACSPSTKIIKYGERKNEFYINNNLNEFLKTNTSPKIVLRIDELGVEPDNNIGSKKSFSYLYNIMENELVKQGYSVKYRSTFNEVISKANSSELLKKELSDADLILEVVIMDDKVVYSTNRVTYIKSKNTTEQMQSMQYESLGAYVEYRLILVKNNEIAGTFKFHYQPCDHGCSLDSFKFTGSGRHKEVKLPKALPPAIMQKFIATSIRELAHSFKEN